MNYLLFQCYAPLVSWGDIAVGAERQSTRQPSKSAIVGLVAAGLGIRRTEEAKLDSLTRSIGFAVQMFSGGTVLKDFHTVEFPKPERKSVYHTRRDELNVPKNRLNTILSRREYRCDALSVIALWLKDDCFEINQICQALLYPVFQLYFGRKSCPPALHLNPKIIPESTIIGAFNKYKVTMPLPVAEKKPDWLKKAFDTYQTQALMHDNTISYFWEKCDHAGLEHLHSTPRYDVPHSRIRWQFITRDEYMTVVARKEEENVFQ